MTREELLRAATPLLGRVVRLGVLRDSGQAEEGLVRVEGLPNDVSCRLLFTVVDPRTLESISPMFAYTPDKIISLCAW